MTGNLSKSKKHQRLAYLRPRVLVLGMDGLPPSMRRSWWLARILGTPLWADFKKIREVYREADRLTQVTGIKHHVDHVIPLNHPRVCGLHVDTNLRAIPAGPNMAKNNHWCPEQLELFDGPEQLPLFR